MKNYKGYYWDLNPGPSASYSVYLTSTPAWHNDSIGYLNISCEVPNRVHIYYINNLLIIKLIYIFFASVNHTVLLRCKLDIPFGLDVSVKDHPPVVGMILYRHTASSWDIYYITPDTYCCWNNIDSNSLLVDHILGNGLILKSY